MPPLLPLHTTSIRFSFPFLTSRTILVHMYIHMFVTTMTGIIKCAISLIGDHIYSIVYKYICLTRQTVYMVHFTHFFDKYSTVPCWTVEIYDISHQSGETATGSDFRHSSNVYDIGSFSLSSSLGVSVLYWTRRSIGILNSTSIYMCTATEFSKLHILFSFTFRYFPLLLFHFLLRFIFFIFLFCSI